jgi:hypothetical protein
MAFSIPTIRAANSLALFALMATTPHMKARVVPSDICDKWALEVRDFNSSIGVNGRNDFTSDGLIPLRNYLFG